MAGLGFAGATYMQDVNKTFCDSTSIPIGTEGRLIDKRDGKVYWVAKLNDGLCWMTQNLDLELYNTATASNIWLTPEDSDVTSNWMYSGNQSNLWNSTNSDLVAYYSPGYSIFADGITPSYANEQLAYGEATDGLTISDAHYLQGNYYTFNAATAGTGKDKTANDTTGSNPATDSICPKGWKLPLSGTSNGLSTSAKLGSFGFMLNKQGITGDASGYNNITKPEYSMYFVRGGNVASGSLINIGKDGYYWSPTSYSSSTAYSFGFYSSLVNPNGYNGRSGGYSVRCVAR